MSKRSATTDQSAAIETTQRAVVPVTPDNFIRAETDLYFGAIALKDGGFGKFFHNREVSPIEDQKVIRQNRDTLYSAAVFDLDAGPVTITLPDAGKRFMSLQLIDEDEYTRPAIYDSAPHTFTKEQVGTRYLLAAVRTLVDPRRSGGCREGSGSPGRDQGGATRRSRQIRGAELGPGQSENGARRLVGVGDDCHRHEQGLRHKG